MKSKEAHAHNKVLPKAGVMSFYDTFVLNRTFVFQINSSAETPRLRQYLKRYIVTLLMTERILLLAVLFSWLLSCRTTNKNVADHQNDLVKVKMLEVKMFNSVSQIKSIKENLDTVFLISPNKREYQIDGSKFIALRLKEVTRFRVGQMEQLGAYLITGSDTLWSGRSIINAPKFYLIVEN